MNIVKPTKAAIGY